MNRTDIETSSNRLVGIGGTVIAAIFARGLRAATAVAPDRIDTPRGCRN